MAWIYYAFVLYLLYLSWIDLKHQEVDNPHLIAFFFFGGILRLVNENIVTAVLILLLTSILTMWMWSKKLIGGADAKLIPVLTMVLPTTGTANHIVVSFYFIILWGILATIYGYTFTKIYGEEKEIPLIPIITLTYIIMLLVRIQ